MIYVEAPDEIEVTDRFPGYDAVLDRDYRPILFIAGGITGCPNWQKTLCGLIGDLDIIVVNPRRSKFDVFDKSQAFKQVEWERRHLTMADMISFWFCKETLCPIVLYELGAWSMMDRPIFVGMDPKYERRYDVEVQTQLACPETPIVYNIKDLASVIREHVEEVWGT